MKILLASASPRRRELLEQIKIPCEVCVSHVGEQVTETDPARIVEELSARKAAAVFEAEERTQEELLVIGADTVVVSDGKILGKPADVQQAVRMLEALSGRKHRVYTGVTCICRKKDGVSVTKTFHEDTAVEFYPMSRAEIEEYAASGDCMDKAGAYGIQGFCARYIRGIEGDYNNVVGLPVGRLYQEIKEYLG